MDRRFPLGAAVALGALATAFGLVVAGVSAYNGLVRLEESVDAQWAQVENVYQRRADLIPNLVATVKGVAEFEKETLTAVVDARSRAVQLPARPLDDPSRFEEHQRVQDQLSASLSRLLVVVERYPELGATAAFRDLMTQLEGSENRITVERMRFNEAARAFNVERRRFPTNLVAGVFRGRFDERPYFRARAGTESAPQVRF